MEESILLSSDSNPSSPLLLPPDLDLDLGIPKAKMSDICVSKHSGLESNVISSKPSSSWSSFEPIPSTSKCIPPLMIPNDGLKDSVSDDNDSFTWRSASLNFESRLSKSGMSSKTDVTDLNTHQPSDSDAGLSDFLSDSEKKPLVKKDENCQTNTLNLNDADECPKWVSVMDEDTDPPSSRSSSTIPPDQAPGALISSVSECSTIPPHRPPSLHSSDSASTLPPEAAHPTRCRNFEKRPSFHDISDSDSTGTVEAVPSTFPDEAVFKAFKYTPHDISLSEDESENPSCSSLSTLPPPLDDKSARLFATQSEPIFPDAHNISEFVSQLVNSPLLTTASSQPLPSQKGARSRVNAVDVLERKRLKELKIKEKQERAAESERLRRMKPGECMKYITVELDQSIVSEYPWAPAVVEILQTAGIKCRVDTSSDPCTVKWTREQADNMVPQQEKHILFLWSTEKLLTSVQYGTLSDSFAELKKKYTHFKMYFCVYGLHSYYRKFHKAKQRQNNTSAPPQRKRKSNYDIIPDQLEMELIALQIKYGISHKILNSPQDTAFFLQTITKSVAEMPFKMEKEKVEMERNWYAKGDSKKCVRIDKDFNGLRQLWLQHLSQFNLSSLDIAKSIAELYPTPLILYHAYRQCLSTKEKETMLQDIVVKRGPGGGGRRLGPELSRKISIMFCQEEDVPLD